LRCVTLPSINRGVMESASWKEPAKIKILVAFEEDHRAYREMLAYAFRTLRPRVEVSTSGVETLEREWKRFGPQLVISSRPRPLNWPAVMGWVELSMDPLKASKIYVCGRFLQVVNPTLERLFTVVEEVEKHTRANGDS
jgi:hypothetical protein